LVDEKGILLAGEQNEQRSVVQNGKIFLMLKNKRECTWETPIKKEPGHEIGYYEVLDKTKGDIVPVLR